ncbi:MAG: GNAT family N-acetyltransferase [Microthrixaceae bacterium]
MSTEPAAIPASALYAEYVAGWETPAQPNRLGLTLIVTRGPAVELVGVVHLGASDDVLTVSYGVAPDRRRLGIASSALSLVSTWALHNAFARVELELGEDNGASHGVALRCGFRPTERVRAQRTEDGVWRGRIWSLSA